MTLCVLFKTKFPVERKTITEILFQYFCINTYFDTSVRRNKMELIYYKCVVTLIFYHLNYKNQMVQ